MNKQFKAVIYGQAHECAAIAEMLRAHPLLAERDHNHCCATSHEDFHMQLVEHSPNLVIVAENGAAGMEGVYLANDIRPIVPVFWFSDDQDFCMQSHRLDCIYFSLKPVTPEKLTKALQHCRHLGISLKRK